MDKIEQIIRRVFWVYLVAVGVVGFILDENVRHYVIIMLVLAGLIVLWVVAYAAAFLVMFKVARFLYKRFRQ